jgi:hypothetical protein
VIPHANATRTAICTELRCFSSSLIAAAVPAPAASSLDQPYHPAPLYSIKRMNDVGPIEYG